MTAAAATTTTVFKKPRTSKKACTKILLPPSFNSAMTLENYNRAFRLVTRNTLQRILGDRYKWLKLNETKKLAKILIYHRIWYMYSQLQEEDCSLHLKTTDTVREMFKRSSYLRIPTPPEPMTLRLQKKCRATSTNKQTLLPQNTVSDGEEPK